MTSEQSNKKPPKPPPPIKLDVKRIQEYLVKHWGPVSCQMCHKGNWAIGDKVFELREFHHGAINLGKGPIIPVIPVICTNCGRTVLINAMTTKLMDEAKKEGENE